jgi:hypothetical protein
MAINYTRQWLSDKFTPDSTLAPDNIAIKLVARLQNIGDYTEPFNMQGYWGIMQLVERFPDRLMSWDEAKDKALKDFKEIRQNARLDSLLGSWRQGAQIVINERTLRKVEKGPAPNPNREKY